MKKAAPFFEKLSTAEVYKMKELEILGAATPILNSLDFGFIR